MKKTRKILFSAALLSSGLTMAQTTTAEKSPNVIYIMADDLGIGDLGCYGQRQIKTPNIDGIAQNGMKFMQHYSGSTVSAPSRCALITGKHMGHAAIRGNAKVAGSDGLLYETPTPHTDSCRCVHSAAMYRFWCVFFPAVEFGGEPAGFQSLYFGAARCHSHTRNRPYGRPRGGYQ